jgi:hypothetical protein
MCHAYPTIDHGQRRAAGPQNEIPGTWVGAQKLTMFYEGLRLGLSVDADRVRLQAYASVTT